MKMLIFGVITGFLFGFLLQRGRVTRYDKQIGALRLIDMTIFKFMFTAVAVSMVGVYLLVDLGAAQLSVRPFFIGGTLTGGILFGIGWGLVGYCPGTAVGALGEGRTDAFWAIIGMLTGAGLYAEAFPFVQEKLLSWGNLGPLTLPQLLGLNHWVVIALMLSGVIGFFLWLERKGL